MEQTVSSCRPILIFVCLTVAHHLWGGLVFQLADEQHCAYLRNNLNSGVSLEVRLMMNYEQAKTFACCQLFCLGKKRQ